MKDYLKDVRDGKNLNKKESLMMIISLSIPVIFAQITSVIMQYIDASMVGHLDTNASASIGLMSTTTWLLNGLLSAFAVGFNVQVAHKIGAKEDVKARNIVRYGLFIVLILSLVLAMVSFSISDFLPKW
ncbi:MAG: MATE family efflux transporter, partial [Butyrivibrio sp.]|nr:MATE family efflux transporter [Butyrivibrio sp.]